MTDLQRVLIGSVARGKTKKGKPTVELFSTDRRLEFPALVLFDLSMLEMVAIDPNELGSDPVHKRFWAYYTESEKKTSRGNPYLDCQYLEPIEIGNGTADIDTTAIVTELRAIRQLLEDLVSMNMTTTTPQVALGDDDENADWIGDPETRAQEQAVHDELEAMHQSRQNGKTGNGVPMDSEELVAWLNARKDNPKRCDGVGHLMYVMKKELGNDWGWPNGTDQAGWNEAAKAWYEYWKALK